MSSNLEAGNLFSVPGLVAVITGAGTGLGLMMAKALALNGAAKVYVLGRRLDKLEEAAKASPHGNIIPIQCDVTSKDSLAAVVSQVEKETGYINLLIANSGVADASMTNLKKDPTLKEYQEYCWDFKPEQFDNVYKVNNTALFFTAIAFLELLDAGNKKGNTPNVLSQIIVTASVASFIRTVTTSWAYISSKAGAMSTAKALATNLAPYDIRANAIAPGFYPSEMTAGAFIQRGVSKAITPAGRVGDEEDMAGTTLYLASRAGAFCNGMTALTDGGRLSIVPSTY